MKTCLLKTQKGLIHIHCPYLMPRVPSHFALEEEGVYQIIEAGLLCSHLGQEASQKA